MLPGSKYHTCLRPVLGPHWGSSHYSSKLLVGGGRDGRGWGGSEKAVEEGNRFIPVLLFPNFKPSV